MEDKESESASARFYAKELKKLNEWEGVDYTSLGEHAKLIRKDIEAGKKGPNAEGFKVYANYLEDLEWGTDFIQMLEKERDWLEEQLSGPIKERAFHEIAEKRHRKRLIEVQEQINKLTKILNELEKE
jgi:hypothetical protein